MQPAYSVRFIAGESWSGAGATAHRYTVPADKVAVVRSVDVVAITTGRAAFGRWSTFWLYMLSTEAMAPWAERHWTGRQVFNAGDTFGVHWTAGTSHWLVSGYLLSA